MDVFKALERFGSANPPSEQLARVLPEIRATAEACESYAYQFVDVGDPEGRMIEVRCWPGQERVTFTVVDHRGLAIGAPVSHSEPFLHDPGAVIESERPRRKLFRKKP